MLQDTTSSPENAVRWLETLKLMANDMGPGHSFQSGITSLLRKLSDRHGFLRAHLVLYDPETETLRLSVADALPKNNHADYAPGVGVTGQVFATGKPVAVERLKGDPVFMSLLFERSDEEMERLSFISVPILAPGSDGPLSAREVIGTLNADTEFISRSDLGFRMAFMEATAALIANEAAHLNEEHTRLRFFSMQSADRGVHEDAGAGRKDFIAQSKVMQHILEQAQGIASGSSPVLICGESGTGKELLAQRMHAMSTRSEVPLVSCHCASVSPEGLQLELCGCQKGAFLGANQTQKGLFERANTGTIFLDSIEYLTEDSQESLLRLMKEREVLRCGASEPVSVDARIIASTNTDLEPLVRQGRFSCELYARLKINSLHVPPLRDRREDIAPLVEHLLPIIHSGKSPEVRISMPALELLTRYFWPGNIAELKTCLQTAAERCENGIIRTGDLPPTLRTTENPLSDSALSLGDAVSHFERELLVNALIKAGGNMLKAARDLKSSYRIVNYKVKKYGIDPRQYTLRGKSA